MSNEQKSPVPPISKPSPAKQPSKSQMLQTQYSQSCMQLGDIAYKLAAAKAQCAALQANHDALVKQCHELNSEASAENARVAAGKPVEESASGTVQ